MPYVVIPPLPPPSRCRTVRKTIGRGVWGTRRLLREKEIDETPQGGLPEEARQLARGKRVVPQTPQALNKRNGLTQTKVSQLRVFYVSWGNNGKKNA
ncbi:hypothetical protein N780_05470 [Pontibacillus chungwhensis BH030062]|uniref:Uncharacterized protein n=1 Tax=Pontibacillus chungwhensis BH030062 TaxID=1385513 RepID=A0A0A2UUK4_9BACI|nr:hypothetical protein N780_05470 [Pontibacillus chungwhensis BH030062]